DQVLDLGAFGNGERVAPHDVTGAVAHRPVDGDPLVGTLARRAGRLHQVHADVDLRQIEAGRQPGFEEQAWPGALGDDLAGGLHPDVAGAVRHIDPVVRVTGVDEGLVI